VVDLFQDAGDVLHDALEAFGHVVERAVGVDHGEFEQAVGIDVGQQAGHGCLLVHERSAGQTAAQSNLSA
jgi:hypothetical protein